MKYGIDFMVEQIQWKGRRDTKYHCRVCGAKLRYRDHYDSKNFTELCKYHSGLELGQTKGHSLRVSAVKPVERDPPFPERHPNLKASPIVKLIIRRQRRIRRAAPSRNSYPLESDDLRQQAFQ